MMKISIIILLIVSFSMVFAKDRIQNLKFVTDDKAPTKIINYNDQRFLLLESVKQETKEDSTFRSKKSGFVAAMLSALVPGAGEYYAESYWRSALFAAIEIVSWSAYFVYTDQGETKDRQMRNFGDENWSEQRYWTKMYLDANTDNLWDGDPGEFNSDGYLEEGFIAENKIHLRRYEANEHTHKLPGTKTQQFYEMIYKYTEQFGAGWIEVGDEWGYYDSLVDVKLKPDAVHYRSLRNKSNDLYEVATTMANVALFNHLVSALDAAWVVKQHNKDIELTLMAQPKNYAGEQVATYGISLSW